MYVSGETGEPSVETTGIIEDIVRQQVVEIVSSPYRLRREAAHRPQASQLHRACRPARIPRHHHQRPHLPNP